MIAAFRRQKDSIFVTMTPPAERFVLILIFGLIWVAVMIAHLGQADPTLVPVLLAFSSYILALSLPFIMPGFKPGIFHPLVFYVLWVGLRGLLTGEAALAAGGLSTHFAPAAAQTDLNRALAMSFALEAVAVLCIYLGYTLVPRARVPKLKTFEATGLAWKSLFWVGVSSIGVLVMFQHAGSLQVLLFQRGIRGEDRIAMQIGAHWIVLAQTATVVPLIWLACNSRAYRQLLFWAVVVFGLIVNFVMTGSHGGTVGAFLVLMFLWILLNRRVSYSLIAVSGLAALSAVGLLGEFRAATQQTSNKFLDEISLSGGFTDWVSHTVNELGTLRGVNSGQIAILATVPDHVPHLYGESYASLPFIFIPSALVKNQPRAGGRLVADYIYNRPETAIPPGGVGEAYWNFSYAGVLFVFLIFGALLRYSADFYRANQSHPLAILVFLLVLLSLSPQTPRIYDFVQSLVQLLVLFALYRYNFRLRRGANVMMARPILKQ